MLSADASRKDNMASQMTAKELAKMVQLCGRAEDQGIIDDDDVKQLIKAMDDAALPTMVREDGAPVAPPPRLGLALRNSRHRVVLQPRLGDGARRQGR